MKDFQTFLTENNDHALTVNHSNLIGHHHDSAARHDQGGTPEHAAAASAHRQAETDNRAARDAFVNHEPNAEHTISKKAFDSTRKAAAASDRANGK